MNAKELGVGSLLWVDGLAYAMKSEDEKWQFLGPQGPAFNDSEVSDWVDVEVIREVKYDYLRGFPVGSVIEFDGGHVAVRHREDFWQVAGRSVEYTFEELDNYISDKNTVRKLK